jgi:hypothetical protein
VPAGTVALELVSHLVTLACYSILYHRLNVS